MRVIVDNKIPFIREAIEHIADEVVYAPGNAFTPELVKDADALVIRTRTHCNRALLEGSRVRFIATATIGFDHIDTEYCREAGIQWANAPGCNAPSVAQYLHSVLLLLQMKRDKSLAGQTMGIVGVGHVGSLVAEVAGDLGMKVLLNDPPREEQEGGRAGPLSSAPTPGRGMRLHQFPRPPRPRGPAPDVPSGRRDVLPLAASQARIHQHLARRSGRHAGAVARLGEWGNLGCRHRCVGE